VRARAAFAKATRRLVVLAALAASALVPAAAGASGPITRDFAVHPGSGIGEPQVAVNPHDTRNLVIGENDSGVSVSRDRGATWKQVALPNPGDNVLAVGPGGRFSYSALDGDVRSSRDGGTTWESVGNWVGTVAAQAHDAAPTGAGAAPGREAGCSAPEPEGPVSADPGEGPGPQIIGCDRPWLAADARTGRLYVSFTVHDDSGGGEGAPAWELSSLACKTTILTNPAFDCGRQYVSASGDWGRTWSHFQPFDSSAYPAGATGGFSAGPVASHGKLATAYLAASVPSGRPCPCTVFETSADDGTTWSRHVVPAAVPGAALVSTEQSTLFEPYTAADPSRAGRYAVMVFDPSQTHLLVFVTADSGVHWRGPARLAEPGGVKRYLPWIAFGPTGALGVIWRTTYPDDTYAAWAAVAPRGGTRFARPVRLSSAPSPGPVSQLAGDDASDLALDSTYLHGVWGDRRGGKLGVRYGRYRFVADPAVKALSKRPRR
jgi:hypothetical protein